MESREAVATKAPKRERLGERKGMLVFLMTVVAVFVALGVRAALRDTSTAFDLGDVAGTLQLANGRAAGGSLTATVTDPKWDTLPVDERKKLASQLLDAEAARGIKALVLIDAAGATRAIVAETPNGRTVIVP
jgi:hypothetical protein